MTQEELKMILHQSSEQGVIDKEETECCDVFRFDKRANDLMTHRRDVIVLHPLRHAKKKCFGLSRKSTSANICWWKTAKDEIIGVVSVKDIILMLVVSNRSIFAHHVRPCLFPKVCMPKRF